MAFRQANLGNDEDYLIAMDDKGVFVSATTPTSSITLTSGDNTVTRHL